MRQESSLRTALVILISAIVPSLLLASTFPEQLYDLVFRLGPPVSHILHALGAFAILLVTCAALLVWRDIGFVRKFSIAVDLGPTISLMAAELSKALGLSAELRVTNATAGGDLNAVVVWRRRIILVPATRLREAKQRPDHFRFRLAHELSHVASNDPRNDRWIIASYCIAALFGLLVLAHLGWQVTTAIVSSAAFGLSAISSAIVDQWLPVTANFVSIGTLFLLLLLDHQAAMRLREYRADSAAAEIAGSAGDEFAVGVHIGTKPRGWLRQLFDSHPPFSLRRDALLADVAALADGTTLALQAYFSATVAEIALQLLLVNASPGISTLSERRSHLAEELQRYPVVVGSVVAVGVFLSWISQFLVIRRFVLTAQGAGAPKRVAMRFLALVALGSGAALASSQTFLWEASTARFNLLAWGIQDPERPAIYVAGLLGLVAMSLVSLRHRLPGLVLVVVAALPCVLQLLVASYFLRS